MKKNTLIIILILVSSALGLIVFRKNLQFYKPLYLFAIYQTPVVPYYWSLTANSELCDKADSYAGLREYGRFVQGTDAMMARCRLVRTEAPGLELWETPAGEMWFPHRTGVSTVVSHMSFGQYSGYAVKEGDIALDVGAFNGDWAITALKQGAAKVIAVEPSPVAIECIRRNLKEELADGRVVLYTKGLWHEDDKLFLATGKSEANSVTSGDGEEGLFIEVTTVDKMVAELGLDQVDVVKMDIEGAEVNAIRGSRVTLQQFRPTLVVATEHTDDKLANNRNVIAAVRELAPFYEHRCGTCWVEEGGGIIPETLYFTTGYSRSTAGPIASTGAQSPVSPLEAR